MDRLATWGAAAATLLALVPLTSIVALTVVKGARALDAAFFTQLPAPVGSPGGGVANALAGSAMLVGVALLLGVPAGVLAGTYLTEVAPRSRLAEFLRFSSDVLAGVPSIVVGLFAYALLVVPLHGFNALAGSVALAIILLPTVFRTTEAALRLVPQELRDAALALGVPGWRVTVGIALRAALPGVATGVLLAMARVAGETAPLLFTAFGNPYWSWSPFKPVAALTLVIFTYAISPYRDWQAKAWGAALVLTLFVLGVNVLTRYFVTRRRSA
jgi:phosphate transport system permease protein